MIWIITIAVIKKGRIKWNVKNRVKVASLIENPPHSQRVMEVPIYGIDDKRLVITVAPQNLICPQGSTYPIKAVINSINKIVIPDNHTFFRLKDLKYKPRPIWR